MPQPKDRPFLEATLQNIEVAVDAATANDVIASIPVIGTAFKICKGIDDLRSRAFAAKLDRFVSDPSLTSAAAKEAIAQKVQGSPEEARKVGETLFLVLDRFIDLDKPELLAKVFVAYLDNIVSATDLQRLAQAIDLAFSGDLRQLVEADEQLLVGSTMDGANQWKTTLIPSGLTINRAGGVTVVKVFNEVTPLGRLLWKAWHHVAQKP